MKKIIKYWVSLSLMALAGVVTSCSEYTPTGYEEVAPLPTITSITASVDNKIVTLNWTLPTDMKDVVGQQLITNGQTVGIINLDPTVTTYVMEGQPMVEEYVYTIKLIYTDNRLSLGKSVAVVVPFEELDPATNLKAEVNTRTVTLTWDLPTSPEMVSKMTGVRVSHNILGEPVDDVYNFPEGTTSCVLRGQPMGVENEYDVQVMYDKYYPSPGIKVIGSVDYYEPKMGYVLLASSVDALPSVGEQVAATWFSEQEGTEFVTPDQIADLDVDIYTVLWIEIMRFGIEAGWQNLPDAISNDTAIEALRSYTQAGGALFLSEQATQLCEPLGIVPAGYNPNMFGAGGFVEGGDVWYINPNLGWDFRNGASQGFYDHSDHIIFEGLEFSEPGTQYDYDAIPLAGPGLRTDNNNMWDCNVYGANGFADVIVNFENVTGSTVLATWGHVIDHCVAGLVDFAPIHGVHGKCVACGFSAYQWYDNEGNNPYQGNIEKLTWNILKYLQ